MSNQTAVRGVGERELPDYFAQISTGLYALAGLHFLGGLYADWKLSGTAIYPWFAIADEPAANSGLFVAAIVILVLGYLASKVGDKIEAHRTEEVDQTQEWTVDVGE
ncbi:hypothetical protein [Halobaculum gomorrense]|uniref:Uncharacterized protein n=1 Tax=Halobaculum gomorrense TaxID=43928 RepID=A0A1M5JKW9_9EURY|nr:hypothetical protein [Halobaculum gomorrense]SHG41171.1 hypothetical protein SAMN05443636_0156 [Halobaculum gomorrense]